MYSVLKQAETYVLGHTESEAQRLITQARFYGDLTAQALHMAGIEPGMHVLDVGCGSGDVTFQLSALVGPTGRVIGLDTSAATIDLARQRAQHANIQNVIFNVGDVMNYSPDEPVDAVVGRLILVHMADPVATLRHVAGLVKPGGIVLFEEIDITSAHSVPELPLVTTTITRLSETFRRAGREPDTGSRLYTLFRLAGLGQPQMIAGARVEGGPDSAVYAYLAETVRSMLPLILRTGIATAEEIAIETFTDRLRTEITGVDGILVTPNLISAWIRRPGSA